MSPPLVVIEGTNESLERVAAELRAAGWTLVRGWTAPTPRGGRLVRMGEIAAPEDAEAALLAALDGAGLLVLAKAHRPTIDRFVDDLRRLGHVDHRIGPVRPEPRVGAEARAILALLAEGLTLGEAAAELGLARRTADRRLAQARTALGTERTTEAIARARRLGWLR